MVTVPVLVGDAVTRPDVPTVAITILLLDHEPNGVASVSAVVRPLHILSTPVIPEVPGFTVITCVAAIVPQLFVTV